MKKVITWSEKNGLLLNKDKTKILPITGKRSSISPIILNEDISKYFVSFARNLGVIFDTTLNWNNHINNIIKKGYMTFHLIKRFIDQWLQKKDY